MFMQVRWMRGLAADPDFAALEIFLLPDRDDFLEPIDREAAGLERLRPMGRRHRNRNRGLADRDHADAMLNRDTHYPPAFAGLTRQLAHLAERHRLVGLVLEA